MAENTPYNSSYYGPQMDNAFAAGLAVRGVDGIVKSDGNGNISAAVAGVDYQTPGGGGGDSWQTGSASGNIAHFTDGVDGQPLESFLVDIQPRQAGSGDPSASNIRAISGWNGTGLYRGGDLAVQFADFEQGSLSSQSGSPTSSTTRLRCGYTAVPAGTYRLFIAAGFRVSYRFFTSESVNAYDASSSNTAWLTGNTEFTVPAGYLRLVIAFSTDITITPADLDVRKVVVCKTAVAEQTVSWQSAAGTVYGAKFNAVTGALTVTHGYIASYSGQTLPGEWISDRAVYAAGTTPPTGAQVVYELATPVIYELTPPTITTLLGINNIWADCGEVAVKYPRDIMTRAEVQRMIDAALLGALGDSY